MAENSTYTPPQVWQWNKKNGGRFANILPTSTGPLRERRTTKNSRSARTTFRNFCSLNVMAP